jgi:RNA polymerase sigma-70 factor (ECF subfamily)
MSSLSPDHLLFEQIRQKDPAALSELYDRYSRLVFGVALKILNDEQAAEEITQDVFLQIWNKAETYYPSFGNAASWIARIARNRSSDQYRYSHVRVEGHSTSWDDCCEDIPVEAPSIERHAITSDQRRSLLRAIRDLPAEQQKALALAFFQGMTHLEIATFLGEPLGTVKTRIRLAMQKLRSFLASEDWRGE